MVYRLEGSGKSSEDLLFHITDKMVQTKRCRETYTHVHRSPDRIQGSVAVGPEYGYTMVVPLLFLLLYFLKIAQKHFQGLENVWSKLLIPSFFFEMCKHGKCRSDLYTSCIV